VRAGELRHRVTVTAPVGVLDEAIEVDIATSVPAKIEVVPLAFQQRENLQTGGLRTQTLYSVTMRYRTDMRADFVLREACCTERLFQILAIIPSDRRDAIEMTCVTNG
jgi:head-tail adaptor